VKSRGSNLVHGTEYSQLSSVRPGRLRHNAVKYATVVSLDFVHSWLFRYNSTIVSIL